MRTAYTADQIRGAELALMATLPEGTLMQRAASGLAVVCATLLGRVYGSRVVLLVGSGDNGARLRVRNEVSGRVVDAMVNAPGVVRALP